MRSYKALNGVIVLSALFAFVLINVHGPTVLAQPTPEEIDDEPTCSLDPSVHSDCSTASGEESSVNYQDAFRNLRDLTRQVMSLTDDTFDDLTLTSTPATWLIMFKTNSCGICKKALPALETLSVDADILSHNDRELTAIQSGQAEAVKQTDDSAAKEEDKTPKGPVYVWEESKDDWEAPKGPVYIATIDAGWYGRDTTKRFEVDATPTIILVRNEGYNEESKVDSRSYYVYRGQRATYPLRSFILGGYFWNKQMDMPPQLADEDRKPQSYSGRVYKHLLSPTMRWIGGIIGKMLLTWFVFMSGLGLFMRVHNYAWGEDADVDYEEREREIEREKAQGRKEVVEDTADERSARRKKIMWERKAENRAKFAAKREARKKKEKGSGNANDRDEFEGVGYSVKKSDILKGANDTKKSSKTKNN